MAKCIERPDSFNVPGSAGSHDLAGGVDGILTKASAVFKRELNFFEGERRGR